MVRATFLRGTLHLASTKDFLALRPALQPVLDAGVHAILQARKARLDFEDVTARARAILAEGPAHLRGAACPPGATGPEG